MKEPYGETKIQDKSEVAGQVVDSGMNIAMVINPKTGPYERVRLNGKSDLIKYFCTGTDIAKSEPDSVKKLAWLLQTTPVDVIRAGSSSIMVGVTDKNRVVYTDSNFNVISALTRIKYGAVNSTYLITTDKYKYAMGDYGIPSTEGHYKEIEASSVNEFVNKVLADAGVVKSFSIKRVNNDTDITSSVMDLHVGSIKVKRLVNIDNTEGTVININGVGYVIGGTNVYDSDLVVIPRGYTANATKAALAAKSIPYYSKITLNFTSTNLICGESYVYKNPTITSIIAGKKSGTFSLDEKMTTWIKDETAQVVYTFDGTLPANLPLSYTVLDMTEKNTLGEFIAIASNYSVLPDINSLIVEYDLDSSIESIKSITVSEPSIDLYNPEVSVAKQNCHVTVNSTCYYCGTAPSITSISSYVKLSDKQLTPDNFISLLYDELGASYSSAVNGNTIIIEGGVTVIPGDLGPIAELKDDYINQTNPKVLGTIAVIARFSSEKDLFSWSMSKSDATTDVDSYEITYNYKDISGTHTMSFVEDAMDDNGNYISYDKFNTISANNYVYFAKISNGEIPESFNSRSFGSQTYKTATETDWSNAISKFMNYEDIHYAFISDGGHGTAALNKAVAKVAMKKNSQFAPSYDTQTKTAGYAIEQHSKFNIDTSQIVHVCFSDRSSCNGQYFTEIPGSFIYMAARALKYLDSANEFDPLFSKKRGQVAIESPIWFNISNEDRQAMLDHSINTCKYSGGVYYFNDNETGQGKNTYLKQEQNVYMTNVIAHLCDDYNETVASDPCNADTWDKIEREMYTIIHDRVQQGKNWTVNNFMIRCNDTELNTQEVVDSDTIIYEVWVQYEKAAKYIKAYVSVVKQGTIKK